MNAELFTEYRNVRKENPSTSAKQCIKIARYRLNEKKNSPPITPASWEDSNSQSNGTAILKKVRWSDESFNYYARIIADYDESDISDLGKFSNQWEPGAISHEEAFREESARGYSHSYRWFIPANCGDSDPKWKKKNNGINPEYAKQNYKKAKTFGEYWYYVGISVKVFSKKNQIELAESSCWRFEASFKDQKTAKETMEYLTEETLEIAAEAKFQAEKSLEYLTEEIFAENIRKRWEEIEELGRILMAQGKTVQ